MITALFGSLALILAAIGLYGVISYAVGRRTREFGIRIAVGAESRSIQGLVIGEALWLLAAGAGIGTGIAWFLGRGFRSMLFGVEPVDALSTVVAVLILGVSALLASWIPACRASRVEPTVALRCE